MWHDCIRTEFQKITNFLNIDANDKDLPKFVTRKWFMFNKEEITMLIKKLESKHQC